jgi:hypothetical protein
MPNYQNPALGSTGKFKAACQYPHLVKIPKMERIFKPRLPFEIYTFQENISSDDFRLQKKPMGSSGFGDVDSYGA